MGDNSNSSDKIYDKYANKQIKAHSACLPILYFFNDFKMRLPIIPIPNPMTKDHKNKEQNVPNIETTQEKENWPPSLWKSVNIL